MRVVYAATSTSNRVSAGATFIGMLSMHNLAETMLGVESTNLLLSSSGDGSLSPQGNHNEPDWFVNAQYLVAYNSSISIPNPISASKDEVAISFRSPFVGFRGVIKLYPHLL